MANLRETSVLSRVWTRIGMPESWRQVGESLGGSQAPPSLWKVPGLPRSFLATSPEVLSLWNLAAIQRFPGSFPDFPGSSPDFPGSFPDFPGGRPLSLGSLTPSPDSQKLSQAAILITTTTTTRNPIPATFRAM